MPAQAPDPDRVRSVVYALLAALHDHPQIKDCSASDLLSAAFSLVATMMWVILERHDTPQLRRELARGCDLIKTDILGLTAPTPHTPTIH